jgi:hypothetical protein
MEQSFLQRVTHIGGDYLLGFVRRHNISSPQQLLALLEHHVGILQAIVQKGRARGADTRALLGQFLGLLPAGFRSHQEELSFVRELLPQLRQQFGV